MPSPSKPAAPRADWLDLFKTLLVYGMISAHLIQLLTLRPRPEAQAVSDIINLITFSGFMFAFGLGLGLSGAGSRRRGWIRTLRPVVLLLLGTYASSLAYEVLVERHLVTPALLVDLLTLRRLFGWSEFLASFFVLYVVLLFARPALLYVGQRLWLLLLAVAACAASTYIVVAIDFPLIATIVGTRNFASFPLLAYLPWLLLGIWFATRPIGGRGGGLAVGATALYYLYVLGTGDEPSRFPPSILFVGGAAAFLMLYLGLSRLIAGRVRLTAFLLVPGRHVFSFLIASNLIIFGTRRLYGKLLRDDLGIALAAIAILGALTIAWLLVEAARHRPTVEAAVPT